MTIPDKLLKKWEALRSSGDNGRIAQGAGFEVSEMTIYRAIKNGHCSEQVFTAIARFYEEKEERIRPFLSKV